MPDPTAVEHGQPTGEDARKFAELFGGYRVSQSLYVMAELGIADLLRDGPRDSDDLAQATEAHPPTLYRVLRFLAAHGILEEVVPHRFALTSLGTMLRSDVRGSRRASIQMQLREANWRPWGHLLQTVRTGETAFDLVHGMTSFEHLDQHPEEAVLFSQAMSTATSHSGAGTAIAYDFATVGTLVDIGGSRGSSWRQSWDGTRIYEGFFSIARSDLHRPSTSCGSRVADRCEIVPGASSRPSPLGGMPTSCATSCTIGAMRPAWRS